MIEETIAHILKKKLVRNCNKFCQEKIGHALLYYKTEPLAIKSLANKYIHTNNWEVLEIIKILNKLGYWVDILDRDINVRDVNKIEDKYDIFIGLGAGDSGKYFGDIGEKLKKAIKIFYACGPEPGESNRLIVKRYEYFYKRNPGKELKLRRTINKVDIPKALKNTDIIFCIGNDFSINTYKKFKKPIFRINPSTSPRISTSINDLTRKNQEKLLYFGGNGNIVKGLDILIEAFKDLPKLELFICAPEEDDFDEVYKEILSNSKNIHLVGFIPVAGKIFNELTRKCGYVILPSCAEGIATSGVNCMRKGLIPIATYEAGIDLKDFGYLIKSLNIEDLKNQLAGISSISREDFKERIRKTYLESFNYTQAKFSEMLEKALIEVLKKTNQLS